MSLLYLFCSKQSPNIFIAKVMKFILLAKGTNKNRNNKKKCKTLQISRASTREIGKSTTCEWHQGKKGEGKSLISKKESAGKHSDFCLIFCKKQPMKHFIPALKRKKRRAAKSGHFTAKTKAISRLNSVER